MTIYPNTPISEKILNATNLNSLDITKHDQILEFPNLQKVSGLLRLSGAGLTVKMPKLLRIGELRLLSQDSDTLLQLIAPNLACVLGDLWVGHKTSLIKPKTENFCLLAKQDYELWQYNKKYFAGCHYSGFTLDEAIKHWENALTSDYSNQNRIQRARLFLTAIYNEKKCLTRTTNDANICL